MIAHWHTDLHYSRVFVSVCLLLLTTNHQPPTRPAFLLPQVLPNSRGGDVHGRVFAEIWACARQTTGDHVRELRTAKTEPRSGCGPRPICKRAIVYFINCTLDHLAVMHGCLQCHDCALAQNNFQRLDGGVEQRPTWQPIFHVGGSRKARASSRIKACTGVFVFCVCVCVCGGSALVAWIDGLKLPVA